MKKIFSKSGWSRKKSSGHSNDADEQKFYETVWSELETDNIQQGLWAKLFSENDGDSDKTKAAYLKARVQQLSDASKADAAEEATRAADWPKAENLEQAEQKQSTDWESQNDSARSNGK